jgi:hypothetical protein
MRALAFRGYPFTVAVPEVRDPQDWWPVLAPARRLYTLAAVLAEFARFASRTRGA